MTSPIAKNYGLFYREKLRTFLQWKNYVLFYMTSPIAKNYGLFYREKLRTFLHEKLRTFLTWEEGDFLHEKLRTFLTWEEGEEKLPPVGKDINRPKNPNNSPPLAT